MDNIAYTPKEFKDMLDRVEDELARQKKEMIDKACEIFDNAKKLGLWNIDFRKAMEG